MDVIFFFFLVPREVGFGESRQILKNLELREMLWSLAILFLWLFVCEISTSPSRKKDSLKSVLLNSGSDRSQLYLFQNLEPGLHPWTVRTWVKGVQVYQTPRHYGVWSLIKVAKASKGNQGLISLSWMFVLLIHRGGVVLQANGHVCVCMCVYVFQLVSWWVPVTEKPRELVLVDACESVIKSSVLNFRTESLPQPCCHGDRPVVAMSTSRLRRGHGGFDSIWTLMAVSVFDFFGGERRCIQNLTRVGQFNVYLSDLPGTSSFKSCYREGVNTRMHTACLTVTQGLPRSESAAFALTPVSQSELFRPEASVCFKTFHFGRF